MIRLTPNQILAAAIGGIVAFTVGFMVLFMDTERSGTVTMLLLGCALIFLAFVGAVPSTISSIRQHLSTPAGGRGHCGGIAAAVDLKMRSRAWELCHCMATREGPPTTLSSSPLQTASRVQRAALDVVIIRICADFGVQVATEVQGPDRSRWDAMTTVRKAHCRSESRSNGIPTLGRPPPSLAPILQGDGSDLLVVYRNCWWDLESAGDVRGCGRSAG